MKFYKIKTNLQLYLNFKNLFVCLQWQVLDSNLKETSIFLLPSYFVVKDSLTNETLLV